MLDVSLQKLLDNFHLDIEFQATEGITGILGRSGSGKSLTLQCLAGLLTPEVGFIDLNGKTLYSYLDRVNIRPQRRNIGYVFQNYALFPHFTVKQNIEFGITHLSKHERDDKVQQFIKKMRLEEVQDKYPSHLSGGQQQRTALARTLITEPDLLLLDEPFAALDNLLRQELSEQLLTVIEEHFQGIALLITHDLEEAYRLCDKLLVYDEGKIVQEGYTKEVFSNPATSRVAEILGYRNVYPIDTITYNVNGLADVIVSDITFQTTYQRDVSFLCINSNEIAVDTKFPNEINTFPCRLYSYREGMNQTTFYLRSQTIEVVVQLDKRKTAELLSRNEQLYFHVPPEHIRLLRK